MEGDPAGKETLEPSVWDKSLLTNMNLKSPRSPRSSRNPSLNTKSLASNPEDLNFEAQFHKLEFQGSQTSRITIEVGPRVCSIKTVKLSSRLCHGYTSQRLSLRYVPCCKHLALRNLCLVPKPCPEETHPRPIPRHSMIFHRVEGAARGSRWP